MGFVMKRQWVEKFYQIISHLGAPASCLFCGEEDVIKNAPFCTECWTHYEQLLSQGCPICSDRNRRCLCIEVDTCKSVTYLLLYGDKRMQRLMYHLKKDASRPEVEFLAHALCTRLFERHGPELPFQCVTYVPRYYKDKRYYGYDHAELLATYVAKELNMECVQFIVNTGKGGEQKRLSKAERAFAAKKRFKLNEKFVSDTKKTYERVLLVDDVLTTGATTEVCSRIMINSGVKEVHAAVIALAGYYDKSQDQ